MTPLYQTVIAALVLTGVTVLAFLGRVNPDAAIALYSTVLGYVFGVAVPTPLRRTRTIDRVSNEGGAGELDLLAKILVIVILVILVLILLGRL
jgi:hypothetical protein